MGYGSASRKEAIPDLLEVKLEAREVGTMDGHEFAVWMPLSGRYAGVPVRIVDYPRWWLKVELTLDLSRLDAEPGPDAKRLVPLAKVPENFANPGYTSERSSTCPVLSPMRSTGTPNWLRTVR